MPDRRFSESTVFVRSSNIDLPPKEVLKRAAKSNSLTPEASSYRPYGALVYLQPNINWDCEGVICRYYCRCRCRHCRRRHCRRRRRRLAREAHRFAMPSTSIIYTSSISEYSSRCSITEISFPGNYTPHVLSSGEKLAMVLSKHSESASGSSLISIRGEA